MSTYQSIQSASVLDGSLVITKPTSLAVGDLMVAGIYINNDLFGTVGVPTPSGWSLQEQRDDAGTGRRLYVFLKIANSGDVAASNFTFTNNGGDGSYHMVGHIIRVTSYGIVAGEANNVGFDSTSLTITGFTPSRVNCLFVAFVAVSDNSAVTVSNFAMATSNPTWTERAETSVTDGGETSAVAAYTATRPEATATGNFTATVTNPFSVDTLAIVIALSPQVSGTVTPTTKVAAYAFNPVVAGAEVEAGAEDPATLLQEVAAWQNTTRPSTTWVNDTK
jgi:hypothetical protein